MLKTKILIANSHIPWGGLGQYSITLAQIFKDAGYDVYGLVTHSKNKLFSEFAKLTIETVYFGDRNLIVKYLFINFNSFENKFFCFFVVSSLYI